MENFNTAVILAGGKSTRMGFDKQTIQVDGTKLINQTIGTLRKKFGEIIIVTNRNELYKEQDLVVITDEIPNKGPLGGIYSALKKSPSMYAYVIACDMSVINLNYINYMEKLLTNSDYEACVTSKGTWVEPFNAFYSKNIINIMVNHINNINNGSIFNFLQKINCLYVAEKEAKRFSGDWQMFNNLNTMQDLERWCSDGRYNNRRCDIRRVSSSGNK